VTEEQVFLAALDLPDATARAAYLDATCGVESAFRKQVETLLANHFRSGEFLDVPAAEQIKAAARDDQTLDAAADARPAEMNPEDESEGLHFLTPSDRPDSLGRLGHYEILQVLGKGGFGIVFRAFDDVLQRVVAIKVMAPQLAVTSPARKRFLREARTSAQVRHENVVHVYEVGEQPLPYLAMEFIPGETLQQRLDRLGPLDVPETLRIGRQIAEGLAAAHANDLIHRDIKPGNVLLEGGHQKVKITDFGLARAADDASMTQSGMIAGTPMYMAPEQALGQTLDQRADLFSLGSVLYQMVSGRAPFRANTTIAVLKRVAEDTPRNIREVIPETPQWLCAIIAKLHAKDPDERYQSAREVADVLADCEAQLKANSRLRDFSRIPRTKPQHVERLKWVAAAAVLLLPLIALTVSEFAGVTHLFRRQQATIDPIKREPTPIQVSTHEGPPLATAPFDAAKAKEHQDAWAEHLAVPVEITNSIGMKLRLIPPGKNALGASGTGESGSAFFLGATEVTVDQFRIFVQDTGYTTVGEASKLGGMLVRAGQKTERDANHIWSHPAFAPSGDHPVALITWHDAMVFCDWLSKQEGRTYRLPTITEWRWAEHAGSTARFYFGDDASNIDAHAWTVGNSGMQTHTVAAKEPNPWGLFDMNGNVWELSYTWQRDRKPVDLALAKGGPYARDRILFLGGAYSALSDGVGSSASGPPDIGYSHLGYRVAIVGDLKAKSPRPAATKQEPLPPT
jgi:serine/threonine protein kinase